MKIWLLLIISFFSSFLLARADDYEWGDCPKVDPVANFDYHKFSGLWYVAQKFDLSTPCWTYYFLDRNNTRKVIQSQNEIINEHDPEKTPGAVGLLEIINSTSPGFMSVRFSDNIIGKADYTVYFTDYENYGAVFRCQKVLFGHRRSATILSRKPYMSPSFVNQARAKLISFNIDISPFKNVNQYRCKYTPQISLESVMNKTYNSDNYDFF